MSRAGSKDDRMVRDQLLLADGERRKRSDLDLSVSRSAKSLLDFACLVAHVISA